MGHLLLAVAPRPDVSPPLTFWLFVVTAFAARYVLYGYDAVNQAYGGAWGYWLAMAGYGLYGLAAFAIGLFDVVRIVRAGLLGEFLLQFLGTLGTLWSKDVSPAADRAALFAMGWLVLMAAGTLVLFLTPFVVVHLHLGGLADKLRLNFLLDILSKGLLVLGVGVPLLAGICLAVGVLVFGPIVGIPQLLHGDPRGFFVATCAVMAITGEFFVASVR